MTEPVEKVLLCPRLFLIASTTHIFSVVGKVSLTSVSFKLATNFNLIRNGEVRIPTQSGDKKKKKKKLAHLLPVLLLFGLTIDRVLCGGLFYV